MPIAPRISVALCTCNGSRFVEAQVESVCGQTLPPFELVVRDDASEDDTVQRVHDVWARCMGRGGAGASRLSVHVNPQRLGVARNFSLAIADCGGDLIALCDQDDVWEPERLARMAARLQARPGTLLLHADAWIADAQGKPTGQTLFQALAVTPQELEAIRRGRAFYVLLDRNLVTGATTTFRRELMDRALPVPPHWLHDEWLGVIAAALGGVDVEMAPLLYYRQHGANQIGARRPTWADEWRRATSVRGTWHADRTARARELLERLKAMGGSVPVEYLAAAEEKVRHHTARAELPRSRLMRVLPVLREIASGRYRRFGRGWRGVMKDLAEAG